jgi:ArsR family transcriptional regulator
MPQVLAILGRIAAVSDPVRCRLLLLLEHQELTVTELCAVLQLPQSTISRHLKTLGDEGWVASRRDGTSRYYSLADPLEPSAARLWPIVRDQITASAAARQDELRVRSVLSRRRAKSQAFFASSAGQWDRLREELFGDQFHLWAVLGLVDPSLVVGDLGCGTGLLSQTIAPYVRRVVAVDASTDMLAAARSRLEHMDNIELKQGDLETLPLENAELDVAMLSLVLHHAPDPARALAEVARVIRPGGRVLVVDMLPHDRTEYQAQMGHVWLGFSEQQVSKFLRGSGFNVVRLRPLPVNPDARGPSLFAAVGTKQQTGDNEWPPYSKKSTRLKPRSARAVRHSKLPTWRSRSGDARKSAWPSTKCPD